MKKTLLLLAGFPGTGKSYLGNQIQEAIPGFVLVSADNLKEEFFDRFGYNNMDEKNEVERRVWIQYYQDMEQTMSNGSLIMSDYPFSVKQHDKLAALAEKYEYQVITIRMTGDIPTIFARAQKRDLSPDRHLSNILSCYHKGDIVEDRQKADLWLTWEEFYKRCTTRGYDTFSLGHLIPVDATELTKIDVPQIVSEVKQLVIPQSQM